MKSFNRSLQNQFDLTERWSGIKNLSPEISCKYQQCATQFANQNNCCRALLDMFLWRNDKISKGQKKKIRKK